VKPVKLLRLLVLDLRRSGLRLAASGCGVAVAVATLVFLTSLLLGLRSTLLNDVLPLNRLEVAAEGRSLGLLGVRFDLGGDTLDEETVARLAGLPGVVRVFPKMKLTVPAVASGGGSILGSGIQTDLVADGIDPELVAEEVGDAFRYRELATDTTCGVDRDCDSDEYCAESGLSQPGRCRRYVPVLVSNHLLELYNGSFRRAYRLPRLEPEAVVGLSFQMTFGSSSIRRAPGPPVVERMRLAGFSDHAIPLGVTLPLDFVRDLNRRFGTGAAGGGFHSVIIELASPGNAASVVAAVENMDLLVTDRGARRVADLTALLLAMLGAVAAAVLAVAAVSVSNAFFVSVWSRRREIGVLRAIGASRGQIRSLFLAEAAVVGAAAGATGVAAAIAMAAVVDWMGRTRVPDFPYKPDSLFVLDPRIMAVAVALSVVACMAGAALPVVRATAKDPADALLEP
jgi:ABC-type lipoprotein release transport system permease subunit